MRKIYFILLIISNIVLKAQSFELTNKNLIRYYELTNEAENKILNNDLIQANNLYKEAFKEFKQPHAKDLQNSMTVALKTNNLETAYTNYQALKCLGKNFDNDFVINNFKNTKNYKTTPCQNTIDLNYKKSLDSLFKIDQYYRKLSGGNYKAYKKELTRSDSITSTKLLKLIQKKGFPNEYNIGLDMKSEVYFHDFYFIIWHQLATNLYSPQQVNFSNEMIKALNDGKIRPDIAGSLLDLNNGRTDYSYFSIYQFIKNDKSTDCCYVSSAFLPEKRTEKISKLINDINYKRKKIGLSSTEDELKKNIFFLNNKDFIFLSKTIEGWNFIDEKEIDTFKKNLKLIKLDDTPH